MSIITAANFDYKGALPNFERDSYETLSDMVSVNENYLPNVFIGVCLETGKAYLFNKSNTTDPELGKWREIASGSEGIRKTDNFSTFVPQYDGEIVQYVGTTNQNYTNGYFYKAVESSGSYTYTRINTQPETDIVDSLDSTSTTSALSANQGKVLNDRISSLEGLGRYLTVWNCSTGLPETNPPESPYVYKSGDYYLIGAVSSTTNYKPTGSSYTIGVASSVVETNPVDIGDVYIYDGTTWKLQYNTQKTTTFASIGGDPYDNSNLANALDSKVSTTDTGNQVYGTDENGEQTTYSIDSFGQVDDVQLNGVSVVENKIANIEPSASDIAYSNSQYPSMQTLQDAMDKLLYVTPSVSISGGGTYEIGRVIESVTLNWSWNKAITSQSLNQGIGSLDISLRTYTYSTAISTNTTFTITGSDGTTTKSASTSVNFLPKRYWGTTTTPTITDSQILGLSSELASNRQQKRTFNCSGGKYWWFVIPTSYCNGIGFKDGNGLAVTLPASCIETRTIVNSQGVNTQVNIYRGEYIQTSDAVVMEVV